MKYQRILLKLSGEALMGSQSHGIDPERIDSYAKEIKKVFDENIEIAIVIGGIFSVVSQVRAKEWIVFRRIIWECWQL